MYEITATDMKFTYINIQYHETSKSSIRLAFMDFALNPDLRLLQTQHICIN